MSALAEAPLPSDVFREPLSDRASVTFVAEESENLDTICYRGSAPLAHLAAISQADVFDQVTNPDGLQRDLSPKHASEAYEYLRRRPTKAFPRAFPEVVLNVRSKRAVKVEIEEQEVSGRSLRVATVEFNLDYLRKHADEVIVSRVDGNHRLWYAAGDARREPVMTLAPFQLHVGLSREQEGSLFIDINANQKGLNSSHLSILRSRLTPEEIELEQNPHRRFARQLAEDRSSPWYGLVHMGGSKEGTKAQGLTRAVNFVSLEQGTRRLITKSQYIHDLSMHDAQYQLIRRYWQAVQEVYAEEWAAPRDHLLLKNMGVLAFSMLGAVVIDRCMSRGRVEQHDMVKLLKPTTAAWNWKRDADPHGEPPGLSGLSGNRAALIVSGRLAEFIDAPADSLLAQRIQDQLLDGEGS